MDYPSGLAEPHALESTMFPMSPPPNWISQRKPPPAVSCSNNIGSLVHQTRISSSLVHNSGAHSHCISEMTAGFLLAHQSKEEATNRTTYITGFAAHPAFNGHCIWLEVLIPCIWAKEVNYRIEWVVYMGRVQVGLCNSRGQQSK